MTKRKNRSLDTIADDIHKQARANIFDIGDLLNEAKDHCDHGDWLNWLDVEFDWSVDTAERYMNVARLGAKFRTLRNLKVCATTLYAVGECEDEDLPAIVQELEKHATDKRLTHKEAERVIKVSIGRHRHGDYPDATLFRIVDLDSQDDDEPWREDTIAALKARRPTTAETVEAIVDEITQAYWDAEQARWDAERKPHDEQIAAQGSEDEREAEAIVDGPPQDLSPSTTPLEPQKIVASTDWAERAPFLGALTELLELRTKPVARFIGVVSADELRRVADFLMAVAAAETAKTQQASGVAPVGADDMDIPAFLRDQSEETA